MNPGPRGPAVVALLLALSLAACGAQPPPATAPAPTAAVDEPQDKHDDSATFNIECNPPAEVKIDGKPIGKSPFSAYKVTPGQHDVTCVDEQSGPQTMTFNLEPGEGRSVSLGHVPSATENQPPPDKGPPGKKKK